MGAKPTPFYVVNRAESPASVSPVVPESTPEPVHLEDIPGGQHNLSMSTFSIKYAFIVT